MRLTKWDLGMDHYDIALPMFRWDTASEIGKSVRFPPGLTAVEWDAPRQNRQAVERLAAYFRREFGYDFLQYSADEGRGDGRYPAVAFLWASPRNFLIDDRTAAVGATCFRWVEWRDAPASWSLSWIWMHPYVRRTGLLSKAWPSFREAFGAFHVERPLSPAMKSFLSGRA